MLILHICNWQVNLLCVIDIFSKYVVPSKDKTGITITNAQILIKYNRKTNKIWVDKGSEVYNKSMKSWLQDNDIEMYSTHNEEKPDVAERFIRTLKNKIYRYMTSVSKNVYIDKLDEIVNKYNNTYRSTIRMKPIDIKSSTYIDFGIENKDKDSKRTVGEHVRI